MLIYGENLTKGVTMKPQQGSREAPPTEEPERRLGGQLYLWQAEKFERLEMPEEQRHTAFVTAFWITEHWHFKVNTWGLQDKAGMTKQERKNSHKQASIWKAREYEAKQHKCLMIHSR